nr:MAG TPA: hypothetical protein [Caudoviricetes sp.]
MNVDNVVCLENILNNLLSYTSCQDRISPLV